MMKKNRLFFIALAAMMALGTGASAQVRNCDLEVEIKSPANNLEMHSGDTAWVEFTITNNGPGTILASDTLWFWDKTYVTPFLATSNIPAKTSKNFTKNLIGVYLIAPVLQSDVVAPFCIKLVNQGTVGNLDHLVTFEDPDTANNWSCVDITLKADGPVGVADLEKSIEEKLDLYPNPVSDEVQIVVNFEHQANVTVSVRDIMGKEVLRKDFTKVASGTASPIHLDIRSLRQGLYFIELKAGTQKALGKICVN